MILHVAQAFRLSAKVWKTGRQFRRPVLYQKGVGSDTPKPNTHQFGEAKFLCESRRVWRQPLVAKIRDDTANQQGLENRRRLAAEICRRTKRALRLELSLPISPYSSMT